MPLRNTVVSTHRMYNTKMISNVSYPLWVMMMYQYIISSCDSCSILVVDVDDGGGCACVGARGHAKPL